MQCYADDTTIIINKPREMKAVNEIYKRHSEASEAKVNEDKTQIFRLGRKEMKQQKEMLASTTKYTPRSQYWVRSSVKIKREKLQKTSRKQMDY